MPGTADNGRLTATSLVRYEVAERRLALPDTSLDLAWVDGRVHVIGPMSFARPSRFAIGTRVVLLSVDPATGAAWLGVPLNEVTDQIVDLRDVHAQRARQLEAHFEAGTVGDMVGGGMLPGSRVHVAALALARGISVAEVAGVVNLCERQLARSFQRTVGLHPKQFQRIKRLRRAVLAAKAGESLAEAAIEGGYADQAHFTREVKMLTGASPRVILPDVGNVQEVAPRSM